MTKRKTAIKIVRNGREQTFAATIVGEGGSFAARVDGMEGLVAVGDNPRHAAKQLQGALILHLDGCEAEGIDPWANRPDVPGLDGIL